MQKERLSKVDFTYDAYFDINDCAGRLALDKISLGQWNMFEIESRFITSCLASSFLTQKLHMGYFGLGRLDYDLGYSDSLLRRLRSVYSLDLSLFEINFNPVQGYCIFGSKSLDQDFVIFEMKSNYLYNLEVEAGQFFEKGNEEKKSEKFEIGLKNFLVNMNEPFISLEDFLFEKLISQICDYTKGEISIEIYFTFLCSNKNFSENRDLDSILVFGKEVNANIAQIISEKVKLIFFLKGKIFEISSLVFKCNHIKDRWCFLLKRAPINTKNSLGLGFFQFRKLRIDNSNNLIYLSQKLNNPDMFTITEYEVRF